jgi:glycosyltransferase involved in cell wall biosynthesis
MVNNLFFSIIIPTYNEESDIKHTISSILNLSNKNYEVIIVDDSDDNTVKVIKSFKSDKIQIIRPDERRGRCEARNIGIKESNGDILIILNADVQLPQKFLDEISYHYLNSDIDYLLVESKVLNTDYVFARYVQSLHEKMVSSKGWKANGLWTEGFSARKEFVMKTNLFPTGFSIPIEAGEDVEFVKQLEKSGARRGLDLSIIITHIAPAKFKEFWKIRKGRGAGSPQIKFFIWKKSLLNIILIEFLKILLFVFSTILIIPLLFNSTLLAMKSKNKIDLLLFPFCLIIEKIAFFKGSLNATYKIFNEERKN